MNFKQDPSLGKPAEVILERGTSADYTNKVEFWEREKPTIQSDFLCRPYVFKLAGDVEGKVVADIGGGEGYVSRYFASHGATKVICVEKSEGLVKSGKSRNEIDGLNIDYQEGDARNLVHVLDESVDSVVSVLVYGHFNDEEMNKAVQETFRILKKGGNFILAVPHPLLYVAQPKSKWISFKSKPDYWQENNEITLRTGDGKEFDITAKNHTVSSYLSALIKNGFEIEELVEPTPTEEDLKNYPDMWGEERVLPTYWIVKSKKASK